MKLLLSLLPLLLASVACLPLPEEIVPVEIKSELKSEETPIIKDTVKLEENSAALTEISVDNNAVKNVEEKITPTINIETVEQKLIKTPKIEELKEAKDSKENKVVIIEAKSVVNKEPELQQKMSTEDISEKKIEIHEDKIETSSDIKETPVVLIKENLKDAMSDAEKQLTEKKSELDVTRVASNVEGNMDDILSDKSKESTESQENKS